MTREAVVHLTGDVFLHFEQMTTIRTLNHIETQKIYAELRIAFRTTNRGTDDMLFGFTAYWTTSIARLPPSWRGRPTAERTPEIIRGQHEYHLKRRSQSAGRRRTAQACLHSSGRSLLPNVEGRARGNASFPRFLLYLDALTTITLKRRELAPTSSQSVGEIG